MPKPTDPKKQSYLFSDDMKFLQKAVVFHPTEPKILTLKRTMNEHSRPGKWDLVGGNVHYGENHEDSLRREIREESGLEIEKLAPVRVFSQMMDGIYHLFIGYKAIALSDQIAISEEHTEYKWVTPVEFRDLESADFLIDLVNASAGS